MVARVGTITVGHTARLHADGVHTSLASRTIRIEVAAVGGILLGPAISIVACLSSAALVLGGAWSVAGTIHTDPLTAKALFIELTAPTAGEITAESIHTVLSEPTVVGRGAARSRGRHTGAAGITITKARQGAVGMSGTGPRCLAAPFLVTEKALGTVIVAQTALLAGLHTKAQGFVTARKRGILAIVVRLACLAIHAGSPGITDLARHTITVVLATGGRLAMAVCAANLARRAVRIPLAIVFFRNADRPVLVTAISKRTIPVCDTAPSSHTDSVVTVGFSFGAVEVACACHGIIADTDIS